MIKIMKRQRLLLIVAPTLFRCEKTAREWGLIPGSIENFRNVTRAVQLRGLAAGTPYIAHDREGWTDTEEGWDLDRALEIVERAGLVRHARPDEIAEYRVCDPVFRREGTEARP